MSSPASFLNSMRALMVSLPARRRRQLVLLLCLMLAGALAEVLSLGAIVPFLAILADPVQALQKPLVATIVSALGMAGAEDLRWQVTLLFAGAVLAAGMVRLALIYATTRFNFGIGHELGAEVYRRALYQPYEVHVARNSSEIIGALNKVDAVVWLVLSLLTASSAILMGLVIIAVLVMIDPLIATIALFGFGSIYAATFVLTRERLARNSHSINWAFGARVQSVQEGLGGIRDVLLDQAQPVFARRFNQIDWSLRQAQASSNIIGPSPRFAVEALGMVLIALLAYFLTATGGGIAAAVPILGALALGAQRLMPLLQQTYQGWVYVASHRQELVEVVSLLQQPVPSEMQAHVSPLQFEREIRMEQASFRYQRDLPLVLRQVDLAIPKGARVGFVGTTGSGKSTLIDLLMGLLQPSTGQLLVDGAALTGAARLAWQRNIAHVPQAIFLSDESFAKNIAFGVPSSQIDLARVRQAAEKAQIAELIETSPKGYDTVVGERGVRLSGGQRQRIGIARALYKQAMVLVFDEATSALDSETEAAVMQSVEGLGPEFTIVLVAHRLTTLQGCDIIYRLHNGELVSSENYQALVAAPNNTLIEKAAPHAG